MSFLELCSGVRALGSHVSGKPIHVGHNFSTFMDHGTSTDPADHTEMSPLLGRLS